MFCKNCGSDIKDGAKFCAVCGTPVPAVSASVCPSCGQAVGPNTKFCASCGTPIAAAAPISEQPVYAAPTAAPVSEQPVYATPTAAPVNEQPVYAAPTAAPVNEQPAYAAPTAAPVSEQPVYATPTAAPVNEQPVYTAPTAAPMNEQPAYSAPTAEAPINEKQADVAAFSNETAEFPNGFNPTSAASVRKPFPKLPIIIGCVAALLVGIFLIVRFFFWGSITQLILGEKGYIKMIEGSSISNVADISSTAANTINTTAGNAVLTADSLYSTYNAGSAIDIAESLADGDIEEAASSAISNAEAAAEGAENLSKLYPIIWQTLANYATNEGLTAEYSIDAEVGSKLQPTIDQLPVKDMVNTILGYINELKFGYSMCGDDNGLQFSMNAKDAASTLLDAVCIVRRDGKIYITMPSVSNKAIYAELELPESEMAAKAAPSLEIDEKELEKLIKSFVDIYLAQLDKASTHIGDTEKISVHGVEVSGKKISVILTTTDFAEIFSKAVDTLRTNEYFKTTVVNFVGETLTYLGESSSFTAADWDSMLNELSAQALSAVGTQSADAIEINTYVSGSNEIVGKTFEIANEFTIKYVKSGGKTIISDDNETVIIAITEKSGNSGTVDLFVKADSSMEFGISVDYNDVKTVDFAGTKLLNGKFELYLSKENDALFALLDQSTMMLGSELADIANALAKGTRICFESKVSSSKVDASYSVYCNDYFKVGVNQTITVGGKQMLDVSSFDLIDVSDISDPMQVQKLQDFITEAGSYYKSILGSNTILSTLGLSPDAIDAAFYQLAQEASALAVEKATDEELSDLKDAYNMFIMNISTLQSLVESKNLSTSSDYYQRYKDIYDSIEELQYNNGDEWLAVKENCSIAMTEIIRLNELAEALFNEINENSETINIYTINGDLSDILNGYAEYNPDFHGNINLCVVDSIDKILYAQASDKVPDIIIVSDDEISEFNNNETIASLSDLGVSYRKNDYYDYTIDAVTVNGSTMALPYVMCPGVVYYRTDYASQYLNINSPEEMSAAIASWSQFEQLAKRLSSASQGSVSAISTGDELINAYMCCFAGTDGSLDGEKLRDFYNTVKSLKDCGGIKGSLDNNDDVRKWSEIWFDGMDDGVMFYFGTPWYEYLDLSISNSNWSCCSAPEGYFFGGTWIYGTNSGAQKKYVSDIIEYLTVDKESVRERILNSDDALSAIKSVMNSVKYDENYDNEYTELYLEEAQDIDVSGNEIVNHYTDFEYDFITILYDSLMNSYSAEQFCEAVEVSYSTYYGENLDSDVFDNIASLENNGIEIPDDVYNDDGSINYERYAAFVLGDDYVDLIKETYGQDFDFSSFFNN